MRMVGSGMRIILSHVLSEDAALVDLTGLAYLLCLRVSADCQLGAQLGLSTRESQFPSV